METGTKNSESKEASGETKSPGRMETIASESRGLFEDIKEWVDLRVQLVQLEIEERIEKTANQVISVIAVVILALFTVLFLFHALALLAAEWLGNPALGYLAVGGLLALITTILHLAKPRFIRRSPSGETSPKKDKLAAAQELARLSEKVESGGGSQINADATADEAAPEVDADHEQEAGK